MERVPSIRPRKPTRGLPSVPPLPVDTDGNIRSLPLDSKPEQSTSLSSADESIVSSPLDENPPPSTRTAAAPHNDTTLTPIRAHYLKKELIQLQFRQELTALTTMPKNHISMFSYLGPPFTPPPKDGPQVDLPFLRYIFRNFVVSFPFLAAAPRDFFPEKLQPFMASMLSRNLSPSSALDDDPEQSEEAVRRRMLVKLERNLAMLLTSATKLVEKEDVVRLTQLDLDRLEMLARKRAARERRTKDVFEVNVIGVRTVIDKGVVRNRAHEEFIVRTRRTHHPDIFVSRRYGDFKTLVAELHKAHPSEVIPHPPPKDRTYVNVTSPQPSPSFSTSMSSSTSVDSRYSNTSNMSPGQTSMRPARSMPGMYDSEHNSSVDSLPNTPSPNSPNFSMGGVQQASRLAREKNRLTLRSYLHTLLGSSTLGSSPVLRSFLLSGPTRLTPNELEDAERREEADRMREEGRKQFRSEITKRVEALRDSVRSVKGELIGPDGLLNIFATIKQTPDVRSLPENYQAVVEWARISLASTVFQNYVASDNASDSFAGMKRLHGLMPYFMLKTVLKISNPIGMIRGVLDLFLAQPFGGRSLLQRMFTGSMMEEVKALEGDIETVKDKVEDPVICEKIRLFIYAPREIQDIYKADAAAENIHVLTAILRSGEEPSLSRAQLQRVFRAERAYQAYLRYRASLADSDDDEGPSNEDAWLYEDLNLLAKLYSRMRDREQLIALIFEGTTSDLLKDIITIFYSPLAQVYRAASIADSLGDLQSFMNDLIRTVEQSEELSQQDPARTVQIFIDLIQRHEQAFYSFVHKVHSKGEGLFDSLLRWIERFLTVMREGIGERISLEFILPYSGPERNAIMDEIDAVARYHYMLKVAYEDKVRRRFGRLQGQDDNAAEDEAAAAIVDGFVREMSFGDVVKGDADDLAAEDSDDEDSDSDESEESDDDDSSGSDEEDSDDDSGSSTEHDVPSSIPQRSGSKQPQLSQRSARPPSSRNSRSMSLRSPARSNSPPPPVPLKDHSLSQPRLKPLPLEPITRRSTLPDETRRGDTPSIAKKSKKDANAPKQPVLHHIPQLLPLFVEMMKPSLYQGQRPTSS